MKSLKEYNFIALKKYAENEIKIIELQDKLSEIEFDIKKLNEINETIEKTGKLPVFSSDDIPF